MVRKSYVRPRQETGVVDAGDLAQEMVDWSTVLTKIGGVLAVAQLRQPTDLHGEMVSNLVMFEWKDRTDAKVQPEVAAPAAPAPLPDPTPQELEQALSEEEAFLAEAEAAEDTSSMEPAAR